jgi:hypothetical protein
MSFDPIELFFININGLRSEYYGKYATEVKHFINNLRFRISLFNDYKNELSKFIALDFNVFDYINPNENRLSDILANLLDPMGNHGQGYLFLNTFLGINNSMTAAIRDHNLDIKNAKICREETTTYIIKSQRRIDITINFGNYAIGIENKPWASEQTDQMKDYNDYLDNKYKGKYILVFIANNPNYEPQSLGDRIKLLKMRNKLIVISYPFELKKWLLSCYKDCSSEKIRWFLHDFTQFIEANFQFQLA